MKDPFEVADFETVSIKLRTLKQTLRPAEVEVLAREVLKRVALQADPPTLEIQLEASRIEALTKALLSPDPAAIVDEIATLKGEDMDLAELYQVYLAGAARRLGTLWEADEISFMDVTMASSRIFGIFTRMRELRPVQRVVHRRTVAVAPVPGEAHTIGAQMAADLLREAGWDVLLLLETDYDRLIEAVEHADCLVLALSASSTTQLPSLARLVVAARLSLPDLKIMISGRVVQEKPDLIELMEPDSVVHNIQFAITELERLEMAQSRH